MALISVSIDIIGSTELKRQIKELSGGNRENIKRMYRKYAEEIYRMEMDLYVMMLNAGLELHKLYVVKTLGDESWFVYDIEDIKTKTPEFNVIVYNIFKALGNMHRSYYDLPISDREINDSEPLENINENLLFDKWAWPT